MGRIGLMHPDKKLFLVEGIVAGTGEAGTLYFADTRALHRAKPVLSGARRMLWNYLA